MFTKIRKARSVWVADRLEVLSDAQILIACVRPDAGADVRRCVESIARLEDGLRDALCRDHVFSAWVDELRALALELAKSNEIGANVGAVTRIAALIQLSIAVLDETEFRCWCELPLPQTLLLPLAGIYGVLPELGRTSGAVELRYGPEKRELVVAGAAVSLTPFTSARSIYIVDKHFECFSDPSGDRYSIEYDDAIAVPSWAASLSEAVDIVSSNDMANALVEGFVSYVVPLRQRETTINLSFSARQFPNVVFKNNELTPYLVGETLVHEADHQFFYAIEGVSNFWNCAVSRQEAVYLSPWRDDPRPLDGVIRGLSAFARVSSYYSTILESDAVPYTARRAVGAMLLRRLRESEVAVRTLAESGQLSEFGHAYVDEIRHVLTEADNEARACERYEEWKAAADAGVAAHRERWLGRNQGGVRA